VIPPFGRNRRTAYGLDPSSLTRTAISATRRLGFLVGECVGRHSGDLALDAGSALSRRVSKRTNAGCQDESSPSAIEILFDRQPL
jgi:hypothetical protein